MKDYPLYPAVQAALDKVNPSRKLLRMNPKKESKKEIKVIAKLADGSKVWGVLYIEHDQRLQDLLNDTRGFLPFYGLIDKERATKAAVERMTLLNKNAIQSIEELAS